MVVSIFSPLVKGQKAAKEVITTSFSVKGVCGMCKERIENAALIKGVKLVEWNKEEQQLKVIYRADKVSIDDVHKALAAAGHSTDKVEATEEAYAKLPGCCGYDSGVKKH